jgi:hypothetical protein
MRAVPLLLSFLLVLSLVTSASAITITFSDLNLKKDVKILVYDAQGNFIGEYNTTDTITLSDNTSYIFVFKPTEQVWFSNPLNAIELFKATMPTFLSYALFFVVIVATGYIIGRVIIR